MPFCMNCGKELQVEEKFCPACGTAVEETVEVDDVAYDYQPKPTPVPKCFTVFAKIAKVIGIVSFVCAFIPYVCVFSCELGPVGIVFSILGKKDPAMISSCKTSLKFSIWGTVLGFVFYILYTIIFAILAS